ALANLTNSPILTFIPFDYTKDDPGKSLSRERQRVGFLQDASDKSEYLPFETRRAELQSVPPDGCRIERLRVRFKFFQSARQASRRLLFEPDAGRRFADSVGMPQWHDGLGRSAPAIGDHRRAAGIRFDGDDAEILLAGEQKRPAAAEMIAQNLVGLPTKEVN